MKRLKCPPFFKFTTETTQPRPQVFSVNGALLACLLAYFERTRTPLTSFIHSFRFSMMFFSSAMLKAVSFCSWSTYVNAGFPLFLAPCFGCQSSRSLITSSFFLQQCPINRSLLIISVSVILGRLPYSSLLVLCSFDSRNLQELL